MKKQTHFNFETIANEVEKHLHGKLKNNGSALVSPTFFGGKESFSIQISGIDPDEDYIEEVKTKIKKTFQKNNISISEILGQHIHENDAWDETVIHYIEYTFITK